MSDTPLVTALFGTTFDFPQVAEVIGGCVKGIDSFNGELGMYTKLFAALDECQFGRPARPLDVVRSAGPLLKMCSVAFHSTFLPPVNFVSRLDLAHGGTVLSGNFHEWVSQVVTWLINSYDKNVQSVARQVYQWFDDVGLELLFATHEWTCEGTLILK